MSRLTGGLSESVDNIASALKDILVNALEDFAVQRINLFEFFSLGLNRGYDEQGFLWSDMLHYRQTGQFGKALWERANEYQEPSDRDKAKAYVLGYLTHMGTDVTGHPFVNSVAGGSISPALAASSSCRKSHGCILVSKRYFSSRQ